jgi:hypothetical protein
MEDDEMAGDAAAALLELSESKRSSMRGKKRKKRSKGGSNQEHKTDTDDDAKSDGRMVCICFRGKDQFCMWLQIYQMLLWPQLLRKAQNLVIVEARAFSIYRCCFLPRVNKDTWPTY